MIGRRKRALIVGPYRAHNFGDDLVGAILARHLQRCRYEVVVPRLGKTNADWLGTRFAENYDGQFESADLVVVGGGGIISDTSGAKPGASYLELVAKAGMSGVLSGKKVLITSVGAGPWVRERSRTLAFATSLISERVGVRDQESYDYLRTLGVGEEKLILGADLALLTSDLLDFTPIDTGRLGLQFDVSAFTDVHENPELPRIVDFVAQFARENASDVVLLRNGAARSEISRTAPNAATLSYRSLPLFLPRLAGLRALFTSHLHLAITAYSRRIPTYSLYVREKTRRFYEQIGHPERALDLRSATLDDARRLIDAIRSTQWSADDDERLRQLKGQSQRLVDFVR